MSGAQACASRNAFASALLDSLSLPNTKTNRTQMVAWMLKEDGATGAGSAQHSSFNPLNTTMPAKGSTNFNSVGVKNYTDCNQGFNATLKTLKLGAYKDIRQGLATQGSIRSLAGLNTWGTHSIPSGFVDRALKEVQ